MRARASRLADKLILGAWVTTNVSQRISRLLVHLPVPVTFNLSQLGAPILESACLAKTVQVCISGWFPRSPMKENAVQPSLPANNAATNAAFSQTHWTNVLQA